MRVTAIDCPHCGAPLGKAVARVAAGELAPCLYCGALLRFSSASSDAAPVVERQLGASVIDRAREAALRGGRDEAVAVCVEEGGVTRSAAEAAVDDVIHAVARRALFDQRLNAFGWLLVFGGLALVGVGVALVVAPWGHVVGGVAAVALGTLNSVVLVRGVVNSIRFALASRGVALIRRSIDVGPTGFSDKCHVHSLALEVVPDGGGEPFRARLVVPVRPTSGEKVREGKRVGVRFDRDGTWIRLDGSREVA